MNAQEPPHLITQTGATKCLLTSVSVGIVSRPSLRYLVLAIAWLLLWRISALMQYVPYVSIWFPPAGLSFAALLIMRWRAIPVLMFCAIVSTFWIDSMYHAHTPWQELLLAGTLFGITHCTFYGIGAELLRRFIQRSAVHSVPTIVITFLIVSCLSALCAALTGIKSMEIAGMLQHASVPKLCLPWWIGDMAGILVLTPLLLGLLSRNYPQIESWFGGLNFQSKKQEIGAYVSKLVISILLLSMIMLLVAHFHHSEIAFSVFFLIIPQMWIVYTESPIRSALSLTLFSTAIALWVAVLSLIEHALVYQFAICVIAADTCFGLAVPVLIASNKQLSKLVCTDSLTKAASKNHFFEYATRELGNARRYNLPISLILLDIDNFKQINDNHGHVMGDRTLVRMIKALRVQLRPSDMIGRFGGDEFMILLPGIDFGGAQKAAERLRQLLQQTDIPEIGLHLSASFGVVDIGTEESIMQAFTRADRMLLQAKHSGCNKVCSERVTKNPISTEQRYT